MDLFRFRLGHERRATTEYKKANGNQGNLNEERSKRECGFRAINGAGGHRHIGTTLSINDLRLSGDVTDHRAATIDFPLLIRPTSPVHRLDRCLR